MGQVMCFACGVERWEPLSLGDVMERRRQDDAAGRCTPPIHPTRALYTEAQQYVAWPYGDRSMTRIAGIAVCYGPALVVGAVDKPEAS